MGPSLRWDDGEGIAGRGVVRWLHEEEAGWRAVAGLAARLSPACHASGGWHPCLSGWSMASRVGRDMGPSLRWDDGWGEVALREREEEEAGPRRGGRGDGVW